MRIRVVVEQVICDRVDHATRSLCAARRVKVCNRMSIVLALEGRELRANVFS